MKTVAIIDLDTPIYKASAATEDRSVVVLHKSTGKQKEFSNRTEFKEVLKSKNKLDRLDEYSIEDKQVPEPIENACHLLKTMINNIIEDTEPDEVKFIISGSTNFRNALELPSKYKGNRTGIRPLNLKEVQQYAKRKYGAFVTDNEEPDDTQIWMGYEELNKGNKPVVVSVDKDSKAYSGLHLYNPDKPEQGIQTIPNLGEILIDSSSTVRATGMMQYGLQILIGDSTDGYRPTELCKVKFGEKSAYKLLKNCQTEVEILEVVKAQYQKWYPDEFNYTAWDGKLVESNWLHMLTLYHKCVRMKCSKDDPLDAKLFFDQYGVEL